MERTSKTIWDIMAGTPAYRQAQHTRPIRRNFPDSLRKHGCFWDCIEFKPSSKWKGTLDPTDYYPKTCGEPITVAFGTHGYCEKHAQQIAARMKAKIPPIKGRKR